MNAVMIIPTGVGCEMGGHAGDSTPVAKLLASVCDKLVVHPNVVNASDINEMANNCLYVEGSQLDRFLGGEIHLEEVKANKILVAVNSPTKPETVNAVSAGRATMGADIEIIELKTPLRMIARKLLSGSATGEVHGWKELVAQVKGHDFDALAISTVIDCERQVVIDYFEKGGVNPWGGVEAVASKLIANGLNKPVAHAPIDDGKIALDYQPIVDPRMGAEMVSYAYLHCVLKGLHKAPRIGDKGLGLEDIDCMISPYGCIGVPHRLCFEEGIPVIVVEENKTLFNEVDNRCIYVKNYYEAVGVMCGIKVGVTRESVTRPLLPTKIIDRGKGDEE